jgi:hypothetical protein
MKSKIINIQLLLAEGPAVCSDKWHDVKTYAEADEKLKMFRCCIPQGSGHYKVDYVLHFDNKASFKGTMCITSDGTESLKYHVEYYFDMVTRKWQMTSERDKQFVIHNRSIDHMQMWKNFLENHDISGQ